MQAKAKKLFIGCLSFSFLMLLGLVISLVLFLKDDPPPNDSDLIFTYSKIPDEENGFLILQQAVAALDRTDEEIGKIADMAADEAWDAAAAADLLKRNEQALQLWAKALGYERIQVPEVKGYFALLPYLSKRRDLACLVSVKARLLAREGKGKEAFDLAMSIVRMGYKLEDDDGCLINYLVAIAIKAIGMHRLKALIPECKLPPGTLSAYARELGKYRHNQPGAAASLKLEYAMAANTLDDLAAGRYSHDILDDMGMLPFGFLPGMCKPNRTRAKFARAFRTLIVNLKRPQALAQPLPESISGVPALLKSGNAMGEVLYRRMGGGLAKVPVTAHQLSDEVAAGQLMLALKAYKLKNGELPKELKALVPDYLPEIPKDAFDGKPLRYSLEKKIIYSVGEDLKDDGGMTPEKIEELEKRSYYYPWKEPDPSFPIKF